LDPDDRFGVLKPLTQSGVFTTKLAEIGVRGLGDHGLGAASERLERLERTSIALAAPLGQGGRVKALATQDGGDPTGIGGAVGLLQDAQLGSRRERPPLGPWQKFGRCGRRWRHRCRLAALFKASSVRQFDWAMGVGHNHEVVLLCPSLNSKGVSVSSSLAQRGPDL
jgi:hypothetical protein